MRELAASVGQHAPILANQVEYHPFLGQDELLDLARRHDFTVTAYSPLARGDVFQDDTLARIAEQHDASPAEISLAWLVSQDKVTAIPKATSADHIESNLTALDIELSDDEIERSRSSSVASGWSIRRSHPGRSSRSVRRGRATPR